MTELVMTISKNIKNFLKYNICIIKHWMHETGSYQYFQSALIVLSNVRIKIRFQNLGWQ